MQKSRIWIPSLQAIYRKGPFYLPVKFPDLNPCSNALYARRFWRLCSLGCSIIGLAVGLAAILSAEVQGPVTLEEILEHADQLQKTSFLESNRYLEQQESTSFTWRCSDQLRYQIALSESYHRLMKTAEARDVLAEALTLDASGSGEMEAARVQALHWICEGLLAHLDGQPEPALHAFKKAVSSFSPTQDCDILAFATGWIGELQYITGFYEAGYQSFREAAKLYEQVGKPSRMAAMLLSAGTSGVAVELEDAMQDTLQVLEIFEKEGDLAGMASVYQNMGYDYQPDSEQSLGFFEKAIELSRQVGDIATELSAIAGLAEKLVTAERVEAAQKTIETGLSLLEGLEDPEAEAHLFRVAGVVYTHTGSEVFFEKAERYLKRAEDIYVRRGSEELVQAAKEGLAELAIARGNFEAALPLAVEMTDWYRRNQEELYPSGLLMQQKIYSGMKDYESAMRVTELYWNAVEAEWKSGLAEKFEMLQKDYESARKTSEIELLEKENLIKEQQIHHLESEHLQSVKLRLFGILLMISLILIILFLVALMQAHRRNMRQTLSTTQQLESQNQELQETNSRLKAISEQRKMILGMAAHDLKNPLASVSASLEMLEEDLRPIMEDARYTQAAEVLELSIKSVDYMHALIERMLESQLAESRSGNLRSEQIPLAESVRQMVSLNQSAASRKSIAIQMQLDASLVVIADSQALKEVVDNLLSNAVKYTPPGGGVVVRVSRSEEAADTALLVVADSGPGVPESEHAQLFEPFSNLSSIPTGGESSNGLGLSIAKTLVEAMQGCINFRNLQAGGAEFTVSLPLVVR